MKVLSKTHDKAYLKCQFGDTLKKHNWKFYKALHIAGCNYSKKFNQVILSVKDSSFYIK